MNIYLLHINKLQQQSLIRPTPAANELVSASLQMQGSVGLDDLLCFFVVKHKKNHLKTLKLFLIHQVSMCAEVRGQVIHNNSSFVNPVRI